ncbi:DNA-3-methyladenine glycosylase 2 family protein [Brevundimonas sp. 2R-24]|uniref:DNA-3-methyladenine glycosylase II n=1 Tax=Peiella sedimenti TaxID=3061083 RepID=A0ABT8SLW6_9CAUL|nr:DNA-3-methyladenine glycosylase 2 family protein [Caulobacteraceae bacterium XZ-24]
MTAPATGHVEIIESATLERLAAREAAFAGLAQAVGPVPWRRWPGGFAGLLKIMVGQQVSLASAAAIWSRCEAGLGEITPETVLGRTGEDLCGMGLSRPKARHAHSIARAFADGRLAHERLAALDEAEARRALLAVSGIGPWTADIYLMFCEGRRDVFPAGDVALQEAMRWFDAREARPDARQAAKRAEAWAPERSAAAHLLWAWYGAVRDKRMQPDVSRLGAATMDA